MKTAVVGAGLAGLSVARRIAAREGLGQVTVFEKARGPGGRIATRRSEHGGFDHGAQYFTLREARIEALAAEWTAAGAVAPWHGRFCTLKRGTPGPDPRPGARRFVGAPRMSALARHLAEGLELETGVRVAAIERESERWRLRSEDASELGSFGRVVVATPPAQAVPLLEAAPAFAEIAASARFAPCQAVMVTFEEPLDPGFDGAFVEESALSWVARQASKPGREPSASFVLHASAEWSEEHVDDRPEDVAELLLVAFAEALGRELPRPLDLQAHRWLYALPSAPLSHGFLWDPERQLGVCGDWLTGARVEAALLSGHALADAIVRN